MWFNLFGRGAGTGICEIQKVLLNISAPDDEVINLNKAINLRDICTSVIEHEPNLPGQEHYSCDFDEGCSTRYEENDLVEFGGDGLTLKDKEFTEQVNGDELGEILLYESSLIDSSEWNTVEELELDLADVYGEEDEDMVFILKGTNLPQLIKKISDISLTSIVLFESATLTTTESGGGVVKILVSVDSGITWYSYHSVLEDWVGIDTDDLSDVSDNSMTTATLNGLDADDWGDLIGESTTIRFAYYISKNEIADEVFVENLTIEVELEGQRVIADQSHFSYSLNEAGNVITYTFDNFEGEKTFTINYIDSEVGE